MIKVYVVYWVHTLDSKTHWIERRMQRDVMQTETTEDLNGYNDIRQNIRQNVTLDKRDTLRPRGATPHPRSGAAAESVRLRRRRNGWEELPHVWSQGRQLGGATPRPRSSGCPGAGGPRGASPRLRSDSEEAAVRRYPSSKVRSSGCALLEQSWRDTPRPR